MATTLPTTSLGAAAEDDGEIDYFAIIPEVLLTRPVSSNAVRLYGVLDRYAGRIALLARARKTLAKEAEGGRSVRWIGQSNKLVRAAIR